MCLWQLRAEDGGQENCLNYLASRSGDILSKMYDVCCVLHSAHVMPIVLLALLLEMLNGNIAELS